jgi:hypothetical protein
VEPGRIAFVKAEMQVLGARGTGVALDADRISAPDRLPFADQDRRQVRVLGKQIRLVLDADDRAAYRLVEITFAISGVGVIVEGGSRRRSQWRRRGLDREADKGTDGREIVGHRADRSGRRTAWRVLPPPPP